MAPEQHQGDDGEKQVEIWKIKRVRPALPVSLCTSLAGF